MLFFFHDAATAEIYTLSLHDALPICCVSWRQPRSPPLSSLRPPHDLKSLLDRKSTRLNSSHANTSYAVFCLKKKTTQATQTHTILVLAISTSVCVKSTTLPRKAQCET